jgi:hypothetical protein
LELVLGLPAFALDPGDLGLTPTSSECEETAMTGRQNTSNDARLEGDQPVAKRRRESRGWGPFSGGQLTAIIITVVVMVMLPVGACVTDAVSGAHASVLGTGQLSAAEAAPRNFITGAVDPSAVVATGIFTPVVRADSTHALVITSAELDIYKDANPGPGEAVALAVSRTDTTCNSVVVQHSFYFEAVVNPGVIGEVVLPFQPGIVIPARRSLCVVNLDETNLGAEVHVFGYRIAAAAGPAGAAFVPRTSAALPPSLRKH